jgi:hypothetical protein
MTRYGIDIDVEQPRGAKPRDESMLASKTPLRDLSGHRCMPALMR